MSPRADSSGSGVGNALDQCGHFARVHAQTLPGGHGVQSASVAVVGRPAQRAWCGISGTGSPRKNYHDWSRSTLRWPCTLAIDEMLPRSLESPHPSTPEKMPEEKLRRRASGLEVSDLLVPSEIVSAHLNQTVVEQGMTERMRCFGDEEHRGRSKTYQRWVAVELPSNLRLQLRTPCLRSTLKGLVGWPQGGGRRPEGGTGAFLAPKRFWIIDRVTPLTRSDISRQTVLCSSNEEALERRRRGRLKIDVSTSNRLVVATCSNPAASRPSTGTGNKSSLPQRVDGNRTAASGISGRRSSSDAVQMKARPKGKERASPIHVREEPRLVSVDTLDGQGEMDRASRRIDEVFPLLTGLLRLIGALSASSLSYPALHSGREVAPLYLFANQRDPRRDSGSASVLFATIRGMTFFCRPSAGSHGSLASMSRTKNHPSAFAAVRTDSTTVHRLPGALADDLRELVDTLRKLFMSAPIDSSGTIASSALARSTQSLHDRPETLSGGYRVQATSTVVVGRCAQRAGLGQHPRGGSPAAGPSLRPVGRACRHRKGCIQPRGMGGTL